ncbi:uncharacterized protein LOC144112715 isoform X2 [Amblyomma americanum]
MEACCTLCNVHICPDSACRPRLSGRLPWPSKPSEVGPAVIDPLQCLAPRASMVVVCTAFLSCHPQPSTTAPVARSSPLSTERPPLHIPGEGLVARFSWGRHAQAQTQICHGDCCCYCPATVCELTAAGRERGATRGQVPLLLHEKGGGDVVEELYPPRAFPAMVREGPAIHDRPEQRWWKEQLSQPNAGRQPKVGDPPHRRSFL